MSTNTTRRTRKTATTTDAPTTDAPTVAEGNEATDATTTPAPSAEYVIPDTTGTDDDTARAAYVEAIGEAYRSADKSAKAAMRSAWARFQSDTLNALGTDPDAVGRLMLIRDVQGVLVTTRATVEHDPADAYVIHLAALEMARTVAANAFREAHGDDAYAAMIDRVNGTLTDDEVTARDALATKLATVRTGTRRTGPVRSVESHIRSALESASAGTILTCAQIHNHRSEAYGPDESPSVGAIGAAHGREMDGIESTTNEGGVKGFRLAA